MEHLEEMQTKALEYAKKKYPKVYLEFKTDSAARETTVTPKG